MEIYGDKTSNGFYTKRGSGSKGTCNLEGSFSLHFPQDIEVVICWTFVVKPQRESVKRYRKGTTPIKLSFLNWVDASHRIFKQLHTLDS